MSGDPDLHLGGPITPLLTLSAVFGLLPSGPFRSGGNPPSRTQMHLPVRQHRDGSHGTTEEQTTRVEHSR